MTFAIRISELVTLAPGFARSALRDKIPKLYRTTFSTLYFSAVLMNIPDSKVCLKAESSVWRLWKLTCKSKFCSQNYLINFQLGMGTIPIPSIDTVDTCELGASIDTGTKYRMFRYCARAVYFQRACAKTCLVKSQMFVKCVNAVLYY